MQDNRACKIIFFDVDGVVVHPGTPSVRSDRPWFSNLQADLSIDFAPLSSRFFLSGQHSPSLMESCSLGQADITHALTPILDQLGYVGTVEEFLKYWFEHDSYIDTELLRVVAELQTTQGYRCYLATNQEHRRASYLWNELELKDHFDGIYYSAMVGHSKKSPDFYCAVASDFDFACPPIYFDDREPFVQIAAEAGWDARLYESVDSLWLHPKLGRPEHLHEPEDEEHARSIRERAPRSRGR